jgi:tetratricopeptide (TPR) repeat protein
VRLFAFTLAAALTSGSAVAVAGPPAGSAASASAATPAPPPDRAREHYERGLSKYNLADFDGAILEFKQSYELSKAPRLLFNLAQAYRLKKDYETALFFYNTYLRTEPSAPNREDVESKIAELRKALEAARKTPPSGPPPRAEGPGAPPAPTSDEARVRKQRLVYGIGAAGVGVALAAVGGGLLGLAAHDSNQLHQVAVNGGVWNSNDDAIYREGDRSQTAGIVLLAVGGAALAAGGVLAVLGLHHKR